MTSEQFEREHRYRVALSIAKFMLRQGVIGMEDFVEMQILLIEKYNPLFGGLSLDSRC